MSDGLNFEGKKFISARDAARLTGYTSDYVGQLCRGGKITSRMVGRSWFVSEDSILQHKKLNATNGTVSKVLKTTESEHDPILSSKTVITDSSKVSLVARKNANVVDSGVSSSLESPLIPKPNKSFAPKVVGVDDVISSKDKFRFLRQISLPYSNFSELLVKAGTLAFSASMVFGAFFFSQTDYAEALYKKIISSPDLVKKVAFTVGTQVSNLGDLNNLVSYSKTGAMVVGDRIQSFGQSGLFIAKKIALLSRNSILSLVDEPSIYFSGAKDAVSRSFKGVVSVFRPTEIATAIVSDSKILLANTFSSALDSFGGSINDVAVDVHLEINKLFSKGGRVLANIFLPKSSNKAVVKIEDKIVQPVVVSKNKVFEKSTIDVDTKNKLENIAVTIPTSRTVIEKTTERLVVGDISRAEVDDRLNKLNNLLSSQIHSISASSNANATYINNVYNNVSAPSHKIDHLTNVILTNPNVSSGTFTNPNISGGTITGVALSASSASFDGNVSVGGQLTVSGNATSTIAGDVAFDTDVLYIDSINNRVGVGTTSPIATFTTYGDMLLSGLSRYLNFGDASGSSGYGFRDNSGVIEFKNLSGVWTGVGTGGGGGSQDLVYSPNFYRLSTTTAQFLIGDSSTTTTNALEVIGSGYFSSRLGIGTTSPFAKLSVSGDGYFDGNLTASNITATGTATISGLGTLGNLLVTGSSTLQNFTFQNATGTSATTTNFYSTRLVAENATTTSFFSSIMSGISSIFSSFTSGLATVGSLTATSTTATSTFSTGGVAIGTSTPYGNGLLTVGTSSPLFYVDRATGNVGIELVNPGQKLVIASASTTYKQGLFSTDNMLLSQLEGGAYFGRIGLKENSIALNNYGKNWAQRNISSIWTGFALSSDGKYQTVAGNPALYRSSDYGLTWVLAGSVSSWSDVAMSSDGKIQTGVKSSGQIYTSDDYGVTWIARDSSRSWRSVAMSADGKYQTATDGTAGFIYTSNNYGNTWTARASSGTWRGVDMSSDGRIQTAMNNGGNAYISYDYGVTWTARGTTGLAWYDVAMSSDGKFQTAVVYNGQIYTSTNYGYTWTARDSNRSWQSVGSSADGRIQMAVPFGGQVYVSTNYGLTWTANGPSGVGYVGMSADGKFALSGGGNTYMYSSSADSYIPYGNFGLATSSPYSRLSVWGSGTGINRLFELTDSASTSLAYFLENGTGYFKGNIGIGTSSPYAMLSVAGEVVARNFTATSTTATSTFAGGITGPGSFTIQSGSGSVGIGTTSPYAKLSVTNIDSGPSFLVEDSNSPDSTPFVVDASGNVGIGTTSPASNLSVSGNAYITSTLGIGTNSVPQGQMRVANQTQALLYISQLGAATDEKNWYFDAEGGDLYWGTNNDTFNGGANYARISRTGVNIDAFEVMYGYNNQAWFKQDVAGIQPYTNSPTARWHIRAGSTAANSAPLKIDSGPLMTSPEVGAIEFLTDKWYGTITTGASRKEFTLNDQVLSSGRVPFATTNGRLTDDTDLVFTGSNLGIGTSSPYAMLSVAGEVVARNFTATSTTATSTFAGGLRSNGYTQITGGLAISGATSFSGGTFDINAGNQLLLGPASIAGTSQGANYSGRHSFQNDLYARTIKGMDNGEEYGEDVVLQGGSGTGNIFASGRGGDIIIKGGASSGGASPTQGVVKLQTSDGTTRFILAENGNIGIGTTSPYAKLSVAGQTVSSYFTATSTTATSTFAGGALFALNGGNVGIGTSSPVSTFSVNTGANRGILFAQNPSYTNYNIISLNGVTTNVGYAGLLGGATSDAGLVVQGGSGGAVDFRIGGNNYARLSSVGNFGIGTTSPYAKLSVVGPVVAEYFNATSTTATSTFAGNLSVEGNLNFNGAFLQNGSPFVGSQWTTSGSDIYYNTGSVGIGSSTPSSKLSINSASTGIGFYLAGHASNTSDLFRISTSTASATSTAFVIDSNGKLGIGTSTPSQELSVAGNALFGVGSGSFINWNLGTFNHILSATTTIVDNTNGAWSVSTSTVVGSSPIISITTKTGNMATTSINGGLSVGGGALLYDYSSGLTSINGLQLSGSMNFDIDAGVVNWVDLPILSAAVGTPQSYTANIGGSSVLTVYGEADGSGGSRNLRVGIGSTTPIAALSVSGTTTSSTSWAFAVSDVASTTKFIVRDDGYVGLSTTTPWGLLSINPSNILGPSFVIGSSTKTDFIVTNGGKVGIGTTSPGQKLSVAGDILGNNIIGQYFTATSTSATSNFAGNLSVIGTTTSGTLNIGIEGSGDSRMYIYPMDSAYGLRVSNSGLTDAFTVASDGTSVFWSNHGIGTSTPSARLSVTGNGTGTGRAFVVADSSDLERFSIQDDGDITINKPSGSTFTLNINRANSNRWAMVNTPATTDTLTFNAPSAGVSNILSLMQSGNVGIGTSTPSGKLHISNSGSSVLTLERVDASVSAGDEIGEIKFYADDTSTVTNFYPASIKAIASNTVGTDINPGILTFNTTGTDVAGALTERMRIDSSGNVGIGSSTPSSKLSINSASTGIGFYLAGHAGNTSDLFRISTSTSSATSTAFVIDSNGKVGIGTTSPYAQLSVAGLVVASYFNADSTSATSTFAGGLSVGGGALNYDFSSGITSVNALEMGALNFESDAGQVSWADMSVTTASVSGLAQSYTAQINNNPILTIFGESDGAGGVRNTLAVGIGTTSPIHQLDILAGSTTDFSTGKTSNYYGVSVNNQATSSTASIIKAGLAVSSTGSWTGTSASNIGLYVSSVTGGTNNYDAIFNGGGNVGIGTTSPYAKLSVVGETVSSYFTATSSTATSTFLGGLTVGASGEFDFNHGGNQLNINSPTTVNGALNIAKGGNSYNIQLSDSAAVLRFTNSAGDVNFSGGGTVTGSSGNLTLRTTTSGDIIMSPVGNVGIGSTTPSQKLTVDGGQSLMYYNSNSLYATDIYNGGGLGLGLRVRAGTAGTIIQGEDSTGNARFTVQSAGNVGIGTTTPQRKLSIYSSSNPVLQLTDSTAGESVNDGFLLTQAGLSSYLENTEVGPMHFRTSATDRMTISSTGNVGIGTTSPYAKLSVVGETVSSYFTATSSTATSTFAGNIAVTDGKKITTFRSDNARYGEFYTDSTATAVTSHPTGNDPLYLWARGSGGYVAFSTGGTTLSNAERVRINSSGNMGIGTTTPSSRLTISVGNTDSANGLVLDRAGSGASDNSARLFWVTDANTYGAVNLAGTLHFGSGGVPGSSSLASYVLSMDAAGDVGIGTSSPYAKLSVTNTGSNPSFLVEDSTTPDSTPFIIDASGNVGVGTTTLGSYKLRIDSPNSQSLGISNSVTTNQPEFIAMISSDNSALSIRFNETAPTGAVPADVWEYRAGGSAKKQIFSYFSVYPTLTVDTYSSRGGIGIGTTTPASKLSIAGWTDDSTNFPLMMISTSTATATSTAFIITSSGKLGVGTTSPYAQLSVSGLVAASYFNADNASTTSTFAGGLNVGNGSIFYDSNSGTTTIPYLEIGNQNFAADSGQVGWIDMPLTSASAIGSVQSYTANIGGSPVLTVYGEADGSGNSRNLRVGIGSTTPLAALSVSGTTTTATSWAFAVSDVASTTRFIIQDAGNVGIGTTSPSEQLSVSERMYIAGTGTSTIQNNLHVLGTLRSSISYNGDLFFANNFSFTEALPLGTTTMQALYLKNQFGSTTLAIDENGNLGLGTTTPSYKIHAIGDIAATAFINTSTREAKKDISYIDEADSRSISEKIRGIKVAEYHYNDEETSAPLRMGIIAEEAPAEVLSVDGKGVDIYKLSTFVLAGVQEQQKRIDSLELRIKNLENSAGSGSNGNSGLSFDSVINYLSSLGARIQNGIAYFRNVIVESLTVGSSQSASGITLYDKVTKAPYCLTIENGLPKSTAGVCELVTTEETATSTPSVPSTPSDSTGDVTPPVITFLGNNPAEIELNSSYIDVGVTASDDSGAVIMPDIVENTVNTAVVGEYKVVYVAHDGAMNFATSTRVVNVINSNAPVAPIVPVDPIATTTDDGAPDESPIDIPVELPLDNSVATSTE